MTDTKLVQPLSIEADVLLTPEEAARRIGMSLSWLAKRRALGDGPPFVKYGRSVRYALSDLLADMRTRTSSPAAPTSSATK
jgi:hypothetical protein